MLRWIVFSALVLGLSSGARADDSAAAQKRAAELARVALPQDVYDNMLGGIVTMIASGIPAAQQKQLPPEFFLKFKAELMKQMPYQEMVDSEAKLFEDHYTAAEMGKLLAFYKSEVGKKALRVMPEVNAKALEDLQARIKGRLPSIMMELQKTVPPPSQSQSAPGQSTAPASP